MTAVKGHTRIWARSPYIIDCVATSGDIVSANVDITLENGSRNAAVTSMDELSSYSLSKTNAIDGVIRFDISPLVGDFLSHTAGILDDTVVRPGQDNHCYFVKVEKSVVDTSGTTDTTAYYMAVDGYSEFMDGLNYAPVTDATGNYGSPEWSPSVAKGTARTIAATDCYRQIGQDSYGIVGLYLGELDEEVQDLPTYGRIKFGSGEDWKTYTEAQGVVDRFMDASDDRITEERQAFQYIPIGAKNLGNDWEDGYDYMRFAHVLRREDSGAGKETQEFIFNPVDANSELGGANIVINMLGVSGYSENLLDPDPGDTYVLTFPAFIDCAVNWPVTDVTASYQSYINDELTLSIPPGNQSLVDCYAQTAVEVGGVTMTLPIVSTDNNLAIVNDNPVLRYEIICEPKYNVIDCFFINKWGAWDCFSFIKKSVQNLDVTSDSYQKSILYSTSAPATAYLTTDNSTERYNVRSRKRITVNTGFVDESFSLLLEEMMHSKRMLIVIDDVFHPVNINTESVELQTSVNNKLINYTLDFEFAYQHKNNVV